MNALRADGVLSPRLPLASAIAVLMCSGCALWPTKALRSLENERELSSKALATPATGAATPQCSDSIANARTCADHAIKIATQLETNAGDLDRGYGYLMVLLGTAGAIAVKSDSGRDQLLEDLAVAVGTLTGLRAVVRPDDQRAVARKARSALSCLKGAADDLTRVATRIGVAGSSNPGTNLANARMTSFNGNLNEALFRAFQAPGGFKSNSLDLSEDASPHVAFAAGAAKSRAASLLVATRETYQAVRQEYERVAPALTEAVLQVIHDMGSALATPVAGIDALAKAQRDSINKLIGESAAAMKEQRKESQLLIHQLGGLAGVPMTSVGDIANLASLVDDGSGSDLEKRIASCGSEPAGSPPPDNESP